MMPTDNMQSAERCCGGFVKPALNSEVVTASPAIRGFASLGPGLVAGHAAASAGVTASSSIPDAAAPAVAGFCVTMR